LNQRIDHLTSEVELLKEENSVLKTVGSFEDQKRLQLVTQITEIKQDVATSLDKTNNINKRLQKENEQLVHQLNKMQGVKKDNSELRALKSEHDKICNLNESDKAALTNLKTKIKKISEDKI